MESGERIRPATDQISSDSMFLGGGRGAEMPPEDALTSRRVILLRT